MRTKVDKSTGPPDCQSLQHTFQVVPQPTTPPSRPLPPLPSPNSVSPLNELAQPSFSSQTPATTKREPHRPSNRSSSNLPLTRRLKAKDPLQLEIASLKATHGSNLPSAQQYIYIRQISTSSTFFLCAARNPPLDRYMPEAEDAVTEAFGDLLEPIEEGDWLNERAEFKKWVKGRQESYVPMFVVRVRGMDETALDNAWNLRLRCGVGEWDVGEGW